MVLLWTKHEGEQREDEEILNDLKDASVATSPLSHPKVMGRPPTGRPFRSPVTTPPATIAVYGHSSPLPTAAEALRLSPHRNQEVSPSERHIVTVKQVSDIVQKRSPRDGISISPRCSSTRVSSGKASNDIAVIPKISQNPQSPSPNTQNESGAPQRPARVKVNRVSTLTSRKTKPEEPETKPSGKKEKRKFYTLPRNWKNQAAGFFLNKGKFKIIVILSPL